MNRRIFIRNTLYGGLGLVTTSHLLSCSKDANDDPVNPSPAHPSITPRAGMDLYGSLIDQYGKPVAGVTVSDGYNCVLTDENGIYQMKRNAQAKVVFYSTPADYAVSETGTVSRAAAFFAAITQGGKRYNFNLKKLAAAENDFTLVCIGDPQVASAADINRYKTETLPDLKAFLEASVLPCYGVVLGDTVSDQPNLMLEMRNATGSLTMPYFTVIGNHDKAGGNASTPRDANAYTAVFGPTNYSWNRGKVHFIAIDNVVFTNNSNYSAGLEDYQIEWLRQDLQHVPTDRMIIVYYHIPIRHTADFKNRSAFFDLLKSFPHVHFMAGHTHYNENFQITNPMRIYEHIHGAACGAWWKSTVNCDGTPNGYGIYAVRGTELTDWYYKPTKYSKDFQMRLHWGDTRFGGPYGYFSYNRGYNVIANVWNADAGWTIEAFEDGVPAGALTKLSTLIDAFAAGYHVGVLNRIPGNYGATGSGQNKHAYLHTLKNTQARTIEIRATDPFGRTYSQTEIITDLATAENY
jgi:hypothetical protein